MVVRPSGMRSLSKDESKMDYAVNVAASCRGPIQSSIIGSVQMGSRIKLYIAAALLLSSLSLFVHAQGGSISGMVIQPSPPTGTGGPAPFASILVCPYLGGSGTPCSPTAQLYLDPGLTMATTNPATSDSNGNYSLWVTPVLTGYIVQVTPINGTLYSYVVGAPAGTVSSVGLSMPASIFSVANSPITSFGTIGVTFQSQLPGLVFGSPLGSPGLPTFRNSSPIDFGSQPANTVLGNCSGITANPTFCVPSVFNGATFTGPVDIAGNLIVTSGGIAAPTLSLSGIATIGGNSTIGGTLGVTSTTSAPTFDAATGYQIANSYGTAGALPISTGFGTTFTNPNILGQSVITSVVAGTGAGTGPTLTCPTVGFEPCIDAGGLLGILTGSGPVGSGATVATMTFGATHSSAYCVLSPSSAQAAALSPVLSVIVTTSGFEIINTGSALAASTGYNYYYVCVFH